MENFEGTRLKVHVEKRVRGSEGHANTSEIDWNASARRRRARRRFINHAGRRTPPPGKNREKAISPSPAIRKIETSFRWRIRRKRFTWTRHSSKGHLGGPTTLFRRTNTHSSIHRRRGGGRQAGCLNDVEVKRKRLRSCHIQMLSG